ncbi:MAG: hypothetical protein H6R22_986 [Chromatiaceae bacterium]|nr:hypothetical protein [Chromatiaceae bacterium]
MNDIALTLVKKRRPPGGGFQAETGDLNRERGEPACKPGSVKDSHSSGTHVTVRLERPTRGHARAARRDPKAARPPIWSCSGWGLPCHRCCHRRGALLPHHFTLTSHLPETGDAGSAVSFLWHFPWARAPQALPGTLPCGARTFLPLRRRRERLSGRLPARHSTPTNRPNRADPMKCREPDSTRRRERGYGCPGWTRRRAVKAVQSDRLGAPYSFCPSPRSRPNR